MKHPPCWAQDLIIRVALDEGIDDLPVLIWRKSKKQIWSTGYTFWKGIIRFTAGLDELDQKLVLLHELAHWITLELHTNKFWDKAWELYRRYKIPIRYAKTRESSYRKGALVAYHRSLKATKKFRKEKKIDKDKFGADVLLQSR